MASPPHRLSKHFPFLVVELALSPFLPAPEVKIVPGGGAAGSIAADDFSWRGAGLTVADERIWSSERATPGAAS